jgi:hypothetical protein
MIGPNTKSPDSTIDTVSVDPARAHERCESYYPAKTGRFLSKI